MFFLKCFSCAFSFVLLANVFQYLLIPSELNKSHHDEESLDPDPDPDPSLDLDEFSRQIRNKIILEHWLQANDWEHLIHWLQQLEVHSLQDFSRLDLPEEGEKYFTHDISEDLEEAAAYLPAPEALPGLERLIWEQILEAKPEIIPSSTKDKTTSPPSPPISTRSLAMTYLGWFIIFFLGLFLYDLGVTPNDVLWGVPLHKSLTQITLPDDLSASNTKTVSVSFFNMKGQPLDVSEHLEEFRAEAWFQYQAVNAFVSPETSGASNVVQFVFTAKKSGRYLLDLKVGGGRSVRGFPAPVQIAAGPADPRNTILVGVRSSTLVLTAGEAETVSIDIKDSFGNPVDKDCLSDYAGRFTLRLSEKLGDNTIDLTKEGDPGVSFVVYHSLGMETLSASMGFGETGAGWYRGNILLDESPIGINPSNSTSPSFSASSLSDTSSSSLGSSQRRNKIKSQGCDHDLLTLIVLSKSDRTAVDKFIRDPNLAIPAFEASLISESSVALTKPKTVYLSLTAKQLSVKEYYFLIIPKRIHSFRIIPTTSVTLVRYSGPKNFPVLRIRDGFQSPELIIKDGNVLAACFHMLMLNKIGGSESFNDKRDFLYRKLLQHHEEKGHRHSNKICLTVDRHELIPSSYKATRWFSEADWAKTFNITFSQEYGYDYGGLSREWFEILTRKMFHPDQGLFVSVEEESEAVFPNPNPGPDVKMKMYKFAGRLVGKCLYESSHGSNYRLHLPARLAKSFLAQLTGLRVSYRHFAQDAPQLYASKIQYLESVASPEDIEALDMNFTDEEHVPVDGASSSPGSQVKTVELVMGGTKIKVTDQNKLEYLDLLAQHRLCLRIKEQTEQFLSGLSQFIPDSLLSLFDESELELLLCGVREYNLEDFKKNHTRVFGVPSRSVEWFWQALDTFNSEQMARLLQFSTGSSQLPPGGFSELKPKFTIAKNYGGQLPTAHTCFNRICLPDHPSFGQFEKALLTAINEGNEGFGLV